MGKITIQDIVELAKNGYKPADVKELFELANTAETKETTPEKVTIKTEPETEPVNAFEELIKKEKENT